MSFVQDLATKLRHRIDGNEPKAWSPYGHEVARRELLFQRRIQLVMIGLGIAMLYGVIAGIGVSEQSVPLQQGVDVSTPEGVKPITIRVTPGGAPAFSSGETEAPDQDSQVPGPIYDQDSAFMAVVVRPILAVIGPLAVALLGLGRIGSSATGKLAELNFGIYKGATPYELHAAGKARKIVFTHREVDAHVFGKERTDYLWGTYLEAPPAGIENVFGEADHDASVRSLRHKRQDASFGIGDDDRTITAMADARQARGPSDPKVVDLRRQPA